MELSAEKKAICSRGNKVVYDCGDRIVKVFNEKKPAADVFNEALNLARVDEAGVDVPNILEVSKAGECWSLATEKIPGVTLADKMEADPDNTEKYLSQMIDLQLAIHHHKAPLLNRQKDKLSRMINSVGDELDDSIRYELLMRLDGKPNHSKICHGDFNPTNVIVGDDDKLYVCDWAHATQGNGSADAATTYLLFKLEDDGDIAETYLDLYCKKALCTKQYVHDWMSIVAAAELARGRAGEKEFLLNWIDVADYS